MLTFVPIALGVLLLIVFWRRLHHKYSSLKFKYALYALRDELRKAAIEGEVDKEDWLFEYFDRSFSKNIANSYYITLPFMIMVSFRHTADKDFEVFKNRFEGDVENSEFYSKLRTKYAKVLRQYLKDQHMVTNYLIFYPLVYLVGSMLNFSKKLTSWINNSMVFPETSDSDRHFRMS